MAFWVYLVISFVVFVWLVETNHYEPIERKKHDKPDKPNEPTE